MTVTGITYCAENMTISAEKCKYSMLQYGCDTAQVIKEETIRMSEFYRHNKEVFDSEKGKGFWLWKPCIVYHKLFDLNEGDILIYIDAGTEVISNLHEVIAYMDDDIFLTTNNFSNAEWTKKWVLDLICPGKWNVEQRQVQASFMMFRKSKRSMDFVKEWLLYSQMPGVITDEQRGENIPTFAEHRYDQSVISALAVRDNIRLHWFPTTTAQHIKIEGDNYPTTLLHHRKRNEEW